MANMKNMNCKQKSQYIWNYYKIHIIATLFLVITLGILIHGQLTKIEYIFNLTIINCYKI